MKSRQLFRLAAFLLNKRHLPNRYSSGAKTMPLKFSVALTICGVYRLPLECADSPVINAGNNCVVNQSCGANNPPIALTTDQRGVNFNRLSGATVDIGAFERQIAPTAAGGRVTAASGRGIFRVLVTMTDSQGNQRQALTNQQGYYQFEGVPGGQVYVFSAFHRRYLFEQPTQVQFIGEVNDGINFVGTTNALFRFEVWDLRTKKVE